MMESAPELSWAAPSTPAVAGNSQDIKKRMEERVKRRYGEDEVKEIRRLKAEKLKNESRMLEIDSEIKECLQSNKADCSRCIELLDELMQLPVSPLMLKKNPEVVDTIRKLRLYFGNLERWTMTDEEKEEFKKQAEIIRQKGDANYCWFKEMFVVPDGMEFEEVFASHVERLKAMTEGMSEMTFHCLVDDLIEPWITKLQQQ